MNKIKFYDKRHEIRYEELLGCMKCTDEYHQAVAYLFALNDDCYRHISDLFNFSEDSIKPYDATTKAWQTDSSMKTTRLAFNLWNGCCKDYESKETAADAEVSRYYSVSDIFCCSDAPYFYEAVRLRFGL